MAGILTRVMGFDPIPTNVGVENAAPTNVIKETEYSFFLLLTDEQIQSVLSKYENNPFEIFLEGKLPGNDSLRPRIRQWLDSNGQFKSASLETKVPVGDSKEEYPNDICQMNFRALAMACDSMTSRVRIHVPLARPDGSPYLKKDGSQMGWELDLFYNPVFDGSINNWVKIELEVDALTVADMDIVNVIPFEYERLINSKSQDPQDRRIIGDLYSTGYNIATNRNADYETIPTIRSVGTEEFFSFSIPGNEDFDLKTIGIASVLVMLFSALAAWIGTKLGGSGSSGGSSGGSSHSTSSHSTPPQVVKMKDSVAKAKAATPAAAKAIPVAKAAAKVVERAAPVVRLRRVIDVGSDIAPLAQRTEEAIDTGLRAKDVNYRVLTRKQIRIIEELKGFDSFKGTWGEPGPCTLHLLLDEINPTTSYFNFLDVALASNMLERAISGNAHGFQYASFMTRAGVLLKNFDLVNQICDPITTRNQIGLVKESLSTVVDSLPAFMTAVDEACEAETPQLNPELIKRVIELRTYFDEANKPKSSYLFMSKDWKDEARLSYVTKEDAIQAKADLEAFVGIGHTFDQVFDLDRLDKLSDELKSGMELAREVSNNLYDVSEQLNKALGSSPGADPDLRKKLVAVFGREDVSKYFNLRNDLTSWASSVSYWVSDMVRISTMTTRICDAIHSGLERTKKGEEWLEKFKEEIKSIDDEDVKAYEQKRYVVHG